MGYKFQFITLAGFHALSASMFELAHGYANEGMTAYVRLQEGEFAMEATATPRPATSARSAPAGSTTSRTAASGGESSTLALTGSTEEEQFARRRRPCRRRAIGMSVAPDP